MKREDTEKAAIKHIDNVLDSTIDYTVINNEEDNYEAGRRDALYDFGHDIFKAGADWRINSVWHEGSEKPDTDKGDLLIIVKDGFGKDIYVRQNAYYVLKYGCKRWAYIKDLIPTEG